MPLRRRGLESLSPSRPLVYSYFARIAAPPAPATPGLRQQPPQQLQQQHHVLACNGFIWNGDPEIDFTLPVDSAPAYAKLVRKGTARVSFVKRPVLPPDEGDDEGEGQGQGTAPPALATAAAPGPGAAAAASGNPPPAAPPPFLGADLLEMPAGLLAELTQAWDAGDWGAAAAASDAAALAWARERDWEHHRHRHRHGSAPPPASYDGGGVRDLDSIPNLRPDVLPVPLAAASTPYMRRDVVIWGDCVKLRYGLKKM